MNIADIMLFHEVARAGSFSRLASTKGISPSTISKSIKRLEEYTHSRLFHRNTRTSGLTAEGIQLLETTKQFVTDAQLLLTEISAAPKKPVGLLRINMPVFLGKQLILPMIQQLSQAHPNIQYDLVLSDRHEDLITNGTNVTIRIGHLPDSELVARKIGEQEWVLCCAPSYLAQYTNTCTIDNLSNLDAIVFKQPSTGKNRPWLIQQNGATTEIHVRAPKLRSSCAESMLEAAVLGLGVAQLPHYMVQDKINQGLLVKLLGHAKPPPTPIFAVLSNRQAASMPVRVFMAALEKHFAV